MTETRRGFSSGLYVKESTMPKTQAMKEDMWMPFNKIKNKEAPYAPLTKEIITKSYLYNA